MKFNKYKIKKNTEKFFSILLKKFFQIIPLKLRFKIFENLGIITYYLVKKRREITINNIKNVFSNKSDEEIKQIAKNSYKTMAKMIMTSIYLSEINNEKYVKIENENILKELSNNTDKSIIIVSLHLGGFEAGSILKKIRPFYAVFRKQKNETVNELMTKWRENGGLNPIKLNDTETLNRVLNEKTIVALASDHRANDVEVNFFNRKVGAVSGPVLLGLKKKIPLVFCYAVFEKNNDIRIVIDGIFEIEKKENLKETIKYNMQKIYEKFEEIIRKYPEQYMWQHNRWKEER